MAAQPAAGGNLAILSQHPPVTAEDWAKNPAAAAMKAIEDLLRRIDQLPLVDKDNGARLPAELALIKDDDTRRLHHTFPDVATAAGHLKHRKTNASLRNILIQIFRNVWPDIVDAVNVSEYDDDDSEFHIRDALSNIVERFPFAVATLKAIEAHCFKGASPTQRCAPQSRHTGSPTRLPCPKAMLTTQGSMTFATSGGQSRNNQE
jgi:hypothetical protein